MEMNSNFPMMQFSWIFSLNVSCIIIIIIIIIIIRAPLTVAQSDMQSRGRTPQPSCCQIFSWLLKLLPNFWRLKKKKSLKSFLTVVLVFWSPAGDPVPPTAGSTDDQTFNSIWQITGTTLAKGQAFRNNIYVPQKNLNLNDRISIFKFLISSYGSKLNTYDLLHLASKSLSTLQL